MKLKGLLSSGQEKQVPTTGQSNYFTLTGASALTGVLAPNMAWQLEEVRIHLSAAGGSGSFTATSGNFSGAAYGTVLFTQDLTAVTDLRWHPEGMNFKRGDSLTFAWANAGTKTYGLEVIWKAI